MLTGKRAKAPVGEYVGSKYQVYGFDVACVGSHGQEKWRQVEDGWDSLFPQQLSGASARG